MPLAHGALFTFFKDGVLMLESADLLKEKKKCCYCGNIKSEWGRGEAALAALLTDVYYGLKCSRDLHLLRRLI